MSQTTTYLPPAQRPTSLIVVGGSTFYQGGYGGPPTNYPTPKANSGSDFDNAYERQRNIISTGQKVGIGIGVTFAVSPHTILLPKTLAFNVNIHHVTEN